MHVRSVLYLQGVPLGTICTRYMHTLRNLRHTSSIYIKKLAPAPREHTCGSALDLLRIYPEYRMSFLLPNHDNGDKGNKLSNTVHICPRELCSEYISPSQDNWCV